MGSTNRRPGRLIDSDDLLRARLRDAPQRPGVYLMRDLSATVVYVGKAANLQNRLRSYFTGVDSLAPRTHRLVERIHDFEVVVCANEREALILENTLIKRYRPRFNVRLKDDKSYLYLKIPRAGATDVAAPGTAREEQRPRRSGRSNASNPSRFPRPYYTRRLARDGARYFGPYTSAQSLRTTVKTLRTIFPFRTCSDEVFERHQVCLDYHIKRCSGPCEARIQEKEYAHLLEGVELFMSGHSRGIAQELRVGMEKASAALDFERAGRLRDRLRAIERVAQRQQMLRATGADEDCVVVALDGGRGMVGVLSVREGRVVGIDCHEIEGVADAGIAECLESFVGQYYGSATRVPRVISLSAEVAAQATLQEYLAAERNGPVDLRVPRRGQGKELVDRARDTAASTLGQRRIVADFDAEKTEQLLVELATALGLDGPPRRIECYDISNTMGTNSVGSMVVFEEGRPKPAHYRHFTIKTVEGSDDFASMRETLRRRFRRFLDERDGAGALPLLDPAGSNGREERQSGDTATSDSRASDDSFGVLPDLILIDGGKGQLSVAWDVLRDAGLDAVPVFGLAKRNEELFLPSVAEPIVLPRDSSTLFLVQRVRDEAHRFAITRHRAKRGKTALRSKLDIIPGLGPARRRALLRQFGTVEAIREATLEELLAVPGVPRPVALSIKELL